MKEISWNDYFATLGKAISRLREVLELSEIDHHDYIRDAAILRFKYSIEMFWKLLIKILHHEKIEATTPRDTLGKAYQYQLIDSEDMWLGMLDDRNNTSHAYQEEAAKRIFEHIKLYLLVFEETYTSLKEKYRL